MNKLPVVSGAECVKALERIGSLCTVNAVVTLLS